MTATPRTERPVVHRFRRDGFSHPDFRAYTPKWHLSYAPIPNDWRDSVRYFRSLCGYQFDGILGGVKVSKAKTPPAGPQCQDCLRESKKMGNAR